MKKVVLGAALAVAFVASHPTANAAALLATCAVNGQALAVTKDTAILNATTTSGTYANIPQAAVTFTQSKAGCVIVTYVAEVNPSAPLAVRPFLDDATTGSPAEYQLTQSENAITTRSATFVYKSVAAGAHTLKMQFVSGNEPNGIVIRRQTLVVQYMK